MKWLVTGAKGMLGTDLVAVLHAAGQSVTATDVDTVDITDPDAVDAALQQRSASSCPPAPS